ncbi:MAG: transposase [Candidatus Yonathbacteria bacterium]|nr:transposase [Candidatus Yonathbacteria bacterium]
MKSDFNKGGVLVWPSEWPERDRLVDIIAFTLKDNHYHFVLQEIKEGGITKFMHKFGTGMTNRFNTRHKETGRLFQGSYKARRVDSDNYLKYLNVYVHIKNIFELYPGGIERVLYEFEDAYQFAIHYPYTSLGIYINNNQKIKEIISSDILNDEFADEQEFKKFARACVEHIFFEESSCGFNFPVEV